MSNIYGSSGPLKRTYEVVTETIVSDEVTTKRVKLDPPGEVVLESGEGMTLQDGFTNIAGNLIRLDASSATVLTKTDFSASGPQEVVSKAYIDAEIASAVGAPFDQDLNTTDAVSFASVSGVDVAALDGAVATNTGNIAATLGSTQTNTVSIANILDGTSAFTGEVSMQDGQSVAGTLTLQPTITPAPTVVLPSLPQTGPLETRCTASSTFNVNFEPWMAFDKTIGVFWIAGNGVYTSDPIGVYTGSVVTAGLYPGEWIGIDLQEPLIVSQISLLHRYNYTNGRGMPNNIVLVGSNDGTNWSLLFNGNTGVASVLPRPDNTTPVFVPIPGVTQAFSQFRLVFSDIIGPWHCPQLGELELVGTSEPDTIGDAIVVNGIVQDTTRAVFGQRTRTLQSDYPQGTYDIAADQSIDFNTTGVANTMAIQVPDAGYYRVNFSGNSRPDDETKDDPPDYEFNLLHNGTEVLDVSVLRMKGRTASHAICGHIRQCSAGDVLKMNIAVNLGGLNVTVLDANFSVEKLRTSNQPNNIQ